jgi:leucine dehydrogenase
MDITELPVDGYEKVVRCRDKDSGLHALIAVHDTTLGPALGGMRMLPYASEDEALIDVLRLSRGMTYKSAVADTGLGGGKSVIIGDPAIKPAALFLAMGRFVDSLGGSYITAEDMNIRIADLEVVQQETRWVTGLAREAGSSGNPSPYTAYGCLVGIEATLQEAFGSPDCKGRTVLIQGIGAVGGRLAEYLAARGAEVIICDINEERVQAMIKEHGFRAVDDEGHEAIPCDVYAPCARGASLNDETIPRLACKVVAGCANNQLAEARHGQMLKDRGILYAPDYVINAGGIINVAVEMLPGGYDESTAMERIEGIRNNLAQVFEIARTEDVPTHDAADLLAERRLEVGRAAKA